MLGLLPKSIDFNTDIEPFTDWLSLHLSLILSRSSHQPFHRRWSLRLPSGQPKTVSHVSDVEDPRGPGHHHSRHGGLGVNTDIRGEGGHRDQTRTQVSQKWKQAFLCELIIQRAMRTIQSVNNALNSQWLAWRIVLPQRVIQAIFKSLQGLTNNWVFEQHSIIVCCHPLDKYVFPHFHVYHQHFSGRFERR